MYPWSKPPTPAPYAVGDTVYSGDSSRGAVVSVDAEALAMGIVWDDSTDGKPITYPTDAPYIRIRYPWEK